MKETVEAVEKFMLASGQQHFGDKLRQEQVSILYWDLVQEEHEELCHARPYTVEELDAICDLIWVLTGLALARGYDLAGAMQEVARSNMSKIDPVTGKVLLREDGKVLKPETYSPPDLYNYL